LKTSPEEKRLVTKVNLLMGFLEKARVNGQQKEVEFFAEQLADTLFQLTLITREKNTVDIIFTI